MQKVGILREGMKYGDLWQHSNEILSEELEMDMQVCISGSLTGIKNVDDTTHQAHLATSQVRRTQPIQTQGIRFQTNLHRLMKTPKPRLRPKVQGAPYRISLSGAALHNHNPSPATSRTLQTSDTPQDHQVFVPILVVRFQTQVSQHLPSLNTLYASRTWLQLTNPLQPPPAFLDQS